MLKHQLLHQPSSSLSIVDPTTRETSINLLVYVATGVTQPLVLSLCADAGVTNPKAQLYMLFYYLGLTFYIIIYFFNRKRYDSPSWSGVLKSIGIGAFDVTAQALNYSGATLAGADIFALVYSSVTVWAAIFSRVLLHRSMTWLQWCSVFVVFGGLLLTATNSIALGPDIARGTLLVVVGSCMHGGTYVLNEAIMCGKEQLPTHLNIGIQGVFASMIFLSWQVIFTLPRFNELILEPMEEAGRSIAYALVVLICFGAANGLHYGAFYHTLKFVPHGATTAGVLKALQAVLVFVAASLAFCGNIGGSEMCFSTAKLYSLITVVGGVSLFVIATERAERSKAGYTAITSDAALEDPTERAEGSNARYTAITSDADIEDPVVAPQGHNIE